MPYFQKISTNICRLLRLENRRGFGSIHKRTDYGWQETLTTKFYLKMWYASLHLQPLFPIEEVSFMNSMGCKVSSIIMLLC